MSGARGAWLGVAVACLAMVLGVWQARAEKLYCSGFAASIVEMERSPTKPPDWRDLDRYLRYLYAEQCVLKPTRTPAREYWYRADGSPLGIEAGFTPPGWDPTQIYRPEEGAYTTTPQIAAECARITSMTPSVCAMLKGMEAACLKPVDSEQRTQCEAILDGRVPDLPAAADPLPPLADVLRSAPAAPPPDKAAIAADPGFQRMCREANANFKQCTVRRENMSSIGGPGNGGTGQAGAFFECQQLYNGVLAMCRSTGAVKGARPGIIVAPAPPAPPQKPAEASGRSAPPPTAPKCPPGTTLNKDGYCLAANQNYCGGGMMCGDGMSCSKSGRSCIPPNGCFPNEKESSTGGCIPAGDQDCGGGNHCPPGTYCNGPGICSGGGPGTGPICGGTRAQAGDLCTPRGGSYDPRRYKLCGTALCNILAECGNNECLSPYKPVAAPRPR